MTLSTFFLGLAVWFVVSCVVGPLLGRILGSNDFTAERRAMLHRRSPRCPALRAQAAWSFLGRFAFMLAFVAGALWAVLAWLDPCAAATLCSGMPLVRAPHAGRGPVWWQRLAVRLRLQLLQARRNTLLHDTELLQRDLALNRRELDSCLAEQAEVDEEIAWARSDLAKLS